MDSKLAPRVLIVDDADNDIKYSSGWLQIDGQPLSYRDTVHETQTNNSFSYEFEGTAISAVGNAEGDSPAVISWTCALDGKPITVPMNLNVLSVLCSAQALPDTKHVLTVNVTIQPGKPIFALDSIQYVPSKGSPALENGVMLIDDSDTDIKYDSNWQESAPESVHNATLPGSSVSFDFTGKGISWVTGSVLAVESNANFEAPSGTYIIDDEEAVSFLLSAVMYPHDPRYQVIFETPELQPGNHTLKVTYHRYTQFLADKDSSLVPAPLSLGYLLVTNAPSSGPTSHRGNKLQPATIGGIIGGVLSLCLLLGIGIVLWRQKVRRRYQRPLGSVESSVPSMNNHIPRDGVEPFPVTSAMREAPPLDKLDHMTGKLLARELPISRNDQSSGSSGSAAPAPNTNTPPRPSASVYSAPTSDVTQLVRHEDSGIRIRRDPVEVPPGYTEA